MPIILALALQAAMASPAPTTTSTGNHSHAIPAAVPQRFSILTDPCASGNHDGNEIIVCGRPETLAPRLPLPAFRGPPNHAVPSNPDMDARVALDGPGIGMECGAYGENCPIGGGGYVIPAAVDAVVGAAKSAFARKPDKRGRVSIPLDVPKPGVNSLQP